ncbi:MrcB family domain-containing protein [Mycobacterium heidelbergense]|uniref:MrcB family domain-containing protein n=1 Tax=Mycobacterium heidelbergense TaxID=53376 RepID=UPI003CEF8402
MRDAIQEVLLWQTEYSSKVTDAMKRRGDLVRTQLPNELRDLLPELAPRVGVDDLRVQGGDGSGSRTEIPWTRVYSQSRSPSATRDWYLVFLFSAGGDRAYLSLNQGTTQWDAGGWRPQPLSDLSARTAWARQVLTDEATFPGPWTTEMRLDNRASELGTLYELGNVVAVEYPIDDVPSDEQIRADLIVGASWLGRIYDLKDEGLYVPGDSPEVSDGVAALDAISRPRKIRDRTRLNAAENKVIEQRAVELVRAYFEGLHYETKDVGSTESYDVKAIKEGQTIKIEVKGTTSDGSDVVLTSNEVGLHEAEYPNNAFAIVRHILLRRNGEQPMATGGELILEMPWKLDPGRLQPIAYRYRTGL